MKGTFLGIDTSNYTTSAAIYKDGDIVLNEKIPVFVKNGERGTRQSDAVFSHIKNLPELMHRIGTQDLSAVGVSSRPRSADGSYMPCFLSGVAVASSIAQICGIPMYSFSHQQGHLMAALYSAGRTDLWEQKILAFHVSGGTTEMLLCEKGRIECIGGTLDLHAGQVIDRIGVRMGLTFPCGRELESVALPLDQVDCYSCVRGLNCNLSGLENKAVALLESGATQAEVAGYTLKSIARTLDKLTANALKEYGKLPIVYAGGVMSNQMIRRILEQKYRALFAEPSFSADNAAGIAVLTAFHHATEGACEK